MYMREFWTLKGVFSTRHLTVMGLLLAIAAVLAMFTTYVTPDFQLFNLAFLPGAVGSMLFGPWAGLCMGFAGDFIGYIVKPMGAYFPGYALSAMVQNLIYALFFYRRAVTLPRAALAELTIAPVIYLGLNALWLHMMSGKTAGMIFTGERFLRQLVLFPLYTALVYIVGRFAKRLMERT